MNQMIDVSRWGRRYGLVAFRPILGAVYRIAIVAREDDTTVRMFESFTIDLNAGERHYITSGLSRPGLIDSDKQVLVTQTLIADDSSYPDAPACLLVPFEFFILLVKRV